MQELLKRKRLCKFIYAVMDAAGIRIEPTLAELVQVAYWFGIGAITMIRQRKRHDMSGDFTGNIE